MNKRSLILIGLLLVGGGLAWLTLRWYAEREVSKPPASEMDMAEAVQRLQIGQPSGLRAAAPTPLDPSHRVRLAIGWLGLQDETSNGQVTDLLTAKLTGAAGLELVDRQSLEAVLRELEMGLSGVARAKDAVRVGKLLRAEWFLLGSPASTGGSNGVVARVVDARTGIMRDAGVFPAMKGPNSLADMLAEFVRGCREPGAETKPRVFLAIGTFQDLSVNSRQAAFPAQLRARLMESYRGSGMTLLEREQVDALLQEVRLDLAGLTEEGATNTPLPMQSAYWLVNGYYQSYETTDFQVEGGLDIARIFGRTSHVPFRGKPDDALFRQIKAAIDSEMARNNGPLWASRKTEAHMQLGIGKELANLGNFGLVWGDNGERTEAARRNTAEAIRAFQTVLLLEQTNREAKLFLAACLRKATPDRTSEARDYYRQILEEPAQDKWVGPAQQALVASFRWGSAQEKARWFASALQANPNSAVADFYRRNAEGAAGDVLLQSGASPKAIELAQQRLIEAVRSSKLAMQGKASTWYGAFGMHDFVDVFGKDKAAAARGLADFLPRLESEFPDLKPHLLAAALQFQVETNGAVAQELEAAMDECIDHPDHVANVRKFWQDARWSVYQWCFQRTNCALAVKLIEGERSAAAAGYCDFNQQEELKLAFAYLGVQRWKEALDVLEQFGGKPVRPEGEGPWGRAFVPVLTDKLAAHCREKLNLASIQDARKFEMGPNCVCMHEPSTFTTDADGVWLAIAGQLIRLDFELKTNCVLNLPGGVGADVTCLCLGRNKLWLGTAGGGLIEYDKVAGHFRHLTEADGLMMNEVSSLYQEGDSLWLGYGGTTGGGLGRFDLPSGKLVSFMSSLNDTSSAQAPPRQPVGSIAMDRTGHLRLLVGGGVREFDLARNIWGSLAQKSGEYVACFTSADDAVVTGVGIPQIEIELGYQRNHAPSPNQTNRTVLSLSAEEVKALQETLKTNGSGQYISSTAVGKLRHKGAVEIHSVNGQGWGRISDPEAIPNPPRTMAFDGDALWVGGEGFIARVDLKKQVVRSFSHIRAQSVECIRIGGGYLWAQYDKHLHRTMLSALR